MLNGEVVIPCREDSLTWSGLLIGLPGWWWWWRQIAVLFLSGWRNDIPRHKLYLLIIARKYLIWSTFAMSSINYIGVADPDLWWLIVYRNNVNMLLKSCCLCIFSHLEIQINLNMIKLFELILTSNGIVLNITQRFS